MSAQASECIRTWCARCQWPGREPFLVGTFTTDARAPDQEAREQAMAHWRDAMGSILPIEVPPPELVELIPGAIIFMPGGDA